MHSIRTHIGGASVDMNMAPAQGLSSPIPSTTDRGGKGESQPKGGEFMTTTRDMIGRTEDQLVRD